MEEDGKLAVVTGANSGLGFQTTKKLAERGYRVVMACRSMEKAEDARSRIDDKQGSVELETMALDLASKKSIESFADSFRQNHDRLDLMVNNAGVMHIPFRRTEFGFEYQYGVNHLGHFYLNSLLMELIEKTPESRVVSVSSLLHRNAELEFDEMNSEESYDRKTAYADSKMANLMYAKELDARFKGSGVDSKAVAAHPGYASTNLQIRAAKTTGGKLKLLVSKAMNAVIAQSAERGAEPILEAATADLDGGEFIGPDGFRQLRADPVEVDPDERAEDRDLRREMWNRSEEEMDVSFEIG